MFRTVEGRRQLRSRPRYWWIATATVFIGSFLAGGVSATHAAASTIPTFTWVGTAAMGKAHNYNWSDGADWSGGVAPTAPGPVDLIFGPLSCNPNAAKCGSAYASDNNISGLTVGNLSLETESSTAISMPAYNISGNSVTLDGLTEKTTVVAGQNIGLPLIYLPISLGRDQTWTFKGGVTQFFGNITGSSSLTVSLSKLGRRYNAGTVYFEGVETVSSINVVGKNTSDSGVSAYANGDVISEPGYSLNANGNPVTVADVGLDLSGASTGSLATSGAFVDIGTSGGSPYGTYSVNGAAAFGNSTYMDIYNLTPGSASPPAPVPGTDYPQLTVSGSLTLGSVELAVFADCDQPVGTTYHLITATHGLSGVFTEAPGFGSGSGPIANGAIIQAVPSVGNDSSCSGTGSTPPYLKFKYDDSSGTFNATVVATPHSVARGALGTRSSGRMSPSI